MQDFQRGLGGGGGLVYVIAWAGVEFIPHFHFCICYHTLIFVKVKISDFKLASTVTLLLF